MAAYAEGLNMLAHANAGLHSGTAPMRRPRRSPNPRYFQYELDVAAIAEVWRHGSIIASRLLDLTAGGARAGTARSPASAGHVADSGEGRWTVQAAIEVGVPAHVLSAALYARFDSRGARRVAEQGALGDAVGLRRPRRTTHNTCTKGRPHERRDCDALVLFGATGDLCYRKIYPALYQLVRRGHPQRPGHRGCPRRAGTSSSWSSACATSVRALEECVHEARSASTRLRGPAALRRRRLQRQRATFTALRQALGAAQRPLHYLAIPPSMFPVVIEHLAASRARPGRPRRGGEALRPRSGLGARQLNQTLHRAFSGEPHLSHRSLPRQGGGAEPSVLPLRQRVSRAGVEPQLRRQRADHDGRELGVGGRGKFYEETGAIRDVIQNHLLQIVALLDDGAAGQRPRVSRCATRR